MAVPIITPQHRWECPNCVALKVTYESRPHTPFHICPGLQGLTAPFVPAGTSCKVEAMDREDYVNGERVQENGEGRPIMSIVTTRDDGMDCAVLAPSAGGRGEV